MVPSITDWLNELLKTGVTELSGTIARDPQTEVAEITLRPLHTSTDWPPRHFAAYGDQLLPLDGAWLFMTRQEYEQQQMLPHLSADDVLVVAERERIRAEFGEEGVCSFDAALRERIQQAKGVEKAQAPVEEGTTPSEQPREGEEE